MEDAINSEVHQKPSGETSESSKKWNTPTGLPHTTQTAQPANKSPNKPNQGWKATKGKNVRQNETRRKELPHFVRTEMEILKHLRRVNRDLRILLQPKYNCVSTPRINKGYQPVRQCTEPPVIKAGKSKVGAGVRKSQNVLAKAINVKPKRPLQQLKPTAGTNRVAPLPTNQSCTRKPQSGVQALPQKFSTATRRSTLQRLMLYFKPKRKPDSSRCAPKPVIKDNNKNDAHETIKCKRENTLCRKLKRGLQATRIAKEKVKARHATKLAEQPVKDNETLKHKLSEEKVLKPRMMGRARILKQKVANGKSLKQNIKDEETPKPIAKEKQPASPCVKNERTIGEKMLAFRLNRLRSEAKSLQNEGESKSALIVNKKQLFFKNP
uniref:Uncharacterized protein n=1 Tax=Bactrocera latifrons TaxID=174628 RepID=A0A0K8VFR7_BACLA